MTRLRHVRRVVAFVCLAVSVAVLAPATASAGVPTCMGRTATVVGTGGDDTLRGTPRADVVVARGGNDRVIGRGGNDLVCAGRGDDVVSGRAGDDTLSGGSGTDVLNGGAGTDECVLGETLSNCETGFEFAVDGSWAGTTSQAKDFSFDVVEHALIEMEITYEWTGANGCTLETTVTIVFEDPEPIEDNAFTVRAAFFTSELFVEGTFDSETSAAGTFAASDTGGPCPGSVSGTWEVSKQ